MTAAVLMRCLVLVGALAIVGCGSSPSGPPPAGVPSEVTGSVTYRERVPLLSDTQLRVTLSETSRADAPAQFIAETTVPDVKRVPIAFRIKLDPRAIDPKRVYTLRARIERGEQLLFINDAQVRVRTGGAPSHVEIVVAPVGRRRD